MSFSIKGKIYSIAKEYLFISIIVLFLGVAGVLLPYLYGSNIVNVQAGSSSLPTVDSNSYTRIIYANSQYNYFFTSSTDGNYNIYLVTSTDGSASTWSEPTTVLSTIRPSIDVDLYYPIYDIQYNSSTDYFGLVAYVSSTDVMVFVTSSDGITWGSQVEIYTAVDGDFSEWIVNMDFLEGTDLISIGYEFDKIAFSIDAGSTWSTSTISAMNPNTDDLLGVGITAGPVLHVGYFTSGAFYYTSSTDSGSTWTTTTVHITTNGSSAFLNRFVMDGNNRPSLLISDTQIGGVGVATSTMIFASRNDNGTWSTSTIGTNSYSFTDDVALSDLDFYGTKPYVTYYGTSNYVDCAYSTSTESPFTFVLSQNIDSSNAIGELSRMSVTYDSANTTTAVAYVNDSGELRFVAGSVDLVGAVGGTSPLAPSDLSAVVATSSITISWTDNSDDEDGFVIQQSTNGVDYSIFTTMGANVTSTVLSSLLPNTHYWAKVAAYNSFGTSTYTASNDDYTNPVVPGTPTVSNVSTSSLTLSWDDNLNGSNTEYYILYSDANFSTSTATTTSITGLTPNTEYTFTVRAQYLSSSTLYTAYSSPSTVTTTVAVNSTPTLTAISPVFATDGTGLVTVTTTVSDGDGDTVTLYVDYSLDGGVTWASSTLGTATGDGAPTTSTGNISDITSTVDGNALTFTWDTQTDGVTVTTTAQIRITPNDSTENGLAQTSSNFTVDNVAPSAPTISTLTSSGPMITFGWDAVSGASTYTVSTTAGSATTTLGMSVAYYNLLSNTQYSFQVLATDAYSNASSYSTVTSTYTDPTAPTSVVASNPGTTTITVSWSGGTNGSGTVYELYNVTDSTVIVTTTETSYAVTSLSINTSYVFKVRTQYLQNNSIYTSYSSDSSAVYTLANQASAPTIGTPTTSTLPITINVNSNPAVTTYAVYNSTDGNYLDTAGASTSTAVYSTTSTLGSSFAATGLSPNTAYQFIVIARNGDDVNAATSTASTATYTFASTPTAPTVTASSATALNVTIADDSATTYAVKVVTGAITKYLQADGTIGDSAVWLTYVQLGNGSATSTTGLTANTSYTVSVAGKNGDGTATAYTATSAVYTLASAPSTVSATADSTTAITVSWSGGTASSYNVQKGSDSAVTGQTSSYQYTGLTCNTSYTFKVYGVNGDGAVTVSYGTVTQSTSACATTGGGGSAPAPTPPPAPAVISPAIVSIVVIPNTSQTISIGNTSHTVTVGTPSTNGQVTITIQSDPITITLKPGEEQLIDTNKDNKDDIFVRYDSLEGGKVKLTLSAIEDLEFSINQALSTTDNRQVVLYFNSPDASLVAISNSSDFANASFETYTPTKQWTLTEGNGTKTVYVKFRTDKGGTREVSDTIILTSQATDQVNGTVCSLTSEQAYKSSNSPAVYYITTDCTKRAFTKSNIFFTYFTSWNDVKTTTKEKLDSILNDTLGFMPWGPKYDPKYGALVKTVKDPKVYLLLNTEKYWITSEIVFNALKYAWNWIEDIDERLLNKYIIGSEITYTDHHPNYTLVKYKNNNKVYRLEPSSAEATAGKQVKRWITDEKTFNSLNFRWDRIVTIPDTEVYEDGENLGTETKSVEIIKYTFTSFLSLDSTGEEVKQLQIRLQELGYLNKDIIPNGNFGSSTKEAVIKLQIEHNLTPALGYTGPRTRSVLNNY